MALTEQAHWLWTSSHKLVDFSLGSDLRLLVCQLLAQLCKLGLAHSATFLELLLQGLAQLSCQPIDVVLHALQHQGKRNREQKLHLSVPIIRREYMAHGQPRLT